MTTTEPASSDVHVSAPEKAILDLARAHRVDYRETEADRMGHAITRLAGDDGELDKPSRLLLALRRAGHITKEHAALLHGAYLKAKFG